MKATVKLLKALADGNRAKIVAMLNEREMCVCEVTAALGLSQSTVSKHLRVMEDAGLVFSRKEGLWVNYALDRARLSEPSAALLDSVLALIASDPEIEALKKALPRIRREEICGRQC
ncbi:MAG: metalloregulator ArsR/SmtB family transcription factor [Thermodesulfobacteriota bacterium]